MTERDVINIVYGSGQWEAMTIREREIAYQLLFWMKKNFGILPEEPSRDRIIVSCLQRACINAFDVPYEEVMRKTNKRPIVERRYIVMRVARDLSKSSPSAFARMFPAYDRCTVNHHALQTADDLMGVDRDFKAEYDRFSEVAKRYFNEMGYESDR